MLLIVLNLYPWGIVHALMPSKINFFQKKSFMNTMHLSVKQTGPTFCRALSGSNLYANVISRRHSVCYELIACHES